ncbi:MULTISPECIES: hypothetical protein [unclassified Microbacterium]|uniref:TetR/AcrR family transcriptional regulator n=1 Tax=unclassified Microbacterium TaxID=2609290 RepID=UPI0015E2AA57
MDDLISTCFRTWEDQPTALSLLRASATNEAARCRFKDNYYGNVLPVLRQYAIDHVDERASIWSAMVMGTALNRLLFEYEPLASMSRHALESYLRRVAQTMFLEPLASTSG